MSQLSRRVVLIAALISGLISGCTTTLLPTEEPAQSPAAGTPTPEPTATPAPLKTSGVLISEFVPGVPGDNNHEFVELYNAGPEAVDLKGWSLWYRMSDDQEEKRLHIWGSPTGLPGYGHLLLVREGEDVGAAPDAVFDVPLFERRGGLQLRNADATVVDTLGWGDAPTDFIADVPAPAPEGGVSLERKPGGQAGNAQDTDDSSLDFVARQDPLPQNSGADTTPAQAQGLVISASAPVTVTPGTEFAVQVTVENHTDRDLADLKVTLPLPEGVSAQSEPTGEHLAPLANDEAGAAGTGLAWTISELHAGANEPG